MMRLRSRSPSMWPTFLKVLELAELPPPPLEIYVSQNKSRVLASCFRDCAPPRFEPAVRNHRPVSVRPNVNHCNYCAVVTAAHSAPAFNRPEAHITILRPHIGKQSATTLPLNKNPGITDHAPRNARFTGTPVVHRRCGLRRWDQRGSTAQQRRRLHQAESLGLFGRPLERG
jgi:hypothetical protein